MATTDDDWAERARQVERARAGDDDAFRRLLDDHRAAITSTLIACGVRTRETAEDLAQDVALKAWRGLGELDDPRAVTAWLRRIAANAARDHLRRLAVRRETCLEAALDLAAADDPERSTARLGELRLMLAALDDEDPEVVELLVARAEGTAVGELAGRLGISDGALKMRLARVRDRLRRRLDDLRRGAP